MCLVDIAGMCYELLPHFFLYSAPTDYLLFPNLKKWPVGRDLAPTMNIFLKQTPILRNSKNFIMWKRQKKRHGLHNPPSQRGLSASFEGTPKVLIKT